MKYSYTWLTVAAASSAMAVPVDENLGKRETPTVYLAGDSTMALGGGGSRTQGNFLIISQGIEK